MSEYRDLRYSIPGWWLVISLVATYYVLEGKLPFVITKNNWMIPVVTFLVSGPALGFFINSFAYIFLTPWFWGCRDRKEQIDRWVETRLEPSEGGYTDNLHSTFGRRWSSSLASFHSFLGIILGLVIGTFVALVSKKLIYIKTILVFSFFIFVAIVHVIHSFTVRNEILKMETKFKEKYSADKFRNRNDLPPENNTPKI